MAYIVLEQNLIEDFFKFYVNKEYSSITITNLLNHFKPFIITDIQLKEQLIKLLGEKNPLIQKLMVNSGGFWKIVKYDKELYTNDFYKEMLEKSKYKILLTKHPSSFNNLDYHKICIQDKSK